MPTIASNQPTTAMPQPTGIEATMAAASLAISPETREIVATVRGAHATIRLETFGLSPTFMLRLPNGLSVPYSTAQQAVGALQRAGGVQLVARDRAVPYARPQQPAPVVPAPRPQAPTQPGVDATQAVELLRRGTVIETTLPDGRTYYVGIQPVKIAGSKIETKPNGSIPRGTGVLVYGPDNSVVRTPTTVPGGNYYYIGEKGVSGDTKQWHGTARKAVNALAAMGATSFRAYQQ